MSTRYTKPLTLTVLPDGPGYFVQCWELNYFAGGSSISDALERFGAGLEATIRLHMERFQSLEALDGTNSRYESGVTEADIARAARVAEQIDKANPGNDDAAIPPVE